MSDNSLHEDKHWLIRPQIIRLLWRIGLFVLLLTVLAALTYEAHPYFGYDGWFAFYATFGFFSCVGMVFFAKFLAVFLKRPDDYYEKDQ